MSQFQQKQIGRRLRALILAQGYVGYERFAYENGFDKGWLGRVLRGEIDPSFTRVIKLAKALDATLEDVYPMKKMRK